MRPQDKSLQEEEEITITLPAQTLEGLGTQLGGGHNGLRSNPSRFTALPGLSEPFPCFKKHTWGEHIIIKITPEHPTTGAV